MSKNEIRHPSIIKLAMFWNVSVYDQLYLVILSFMYQSLPRIILKSFEYIDVTSFLEFGWIDMIWPYFMFWKNSEREDWCHSYAWLHTECAWASKNQIRYQKNTSGCVLLRVCLSWVRIIFCLFISNTSFLL